MEKKAAYFVLMEQWVDAENPNKYPHRNLGTFATEQEASEAGKLRKPQHGGGILKVIEVPLLQRKTTPKKRRRPTNLRRPQH
jgi:hypothetical protein